MRPSGTSADDGELVDQEAARIIRILNAPETRRAVEVYLEFVVAKRKVKDLIDS